MYSSLYELTVIEKQGNGGARQGNEKEKERVQNSTETLTRHRKKERVATKGLLLQGYADNKKE